MDIFLEFWKTEYVTKIALQVKIILPEPNPPKYWDFSYVITMFGCAELIYLHLYIINLIDLVGINIKIKFGSSHNFVDGENPEV